MKREGIKIVMITAYTYYQALIADAAGVDGILVGDSLGMVIMGYQSTLPVTLPQIVHHLKAVLNARPKALVVADMPFLSYEVSRDEAVRNAGKLIKLGADAVKVEGGTEIIDKVEAMIKAGIPVMGHIGLNPQRYLQLGGYKLRGKTVDDALKIIEDAKALEEVGVFSIVIEFTVAEVAKKVTEIVKIPTICIGSGPYCDGQVLVFHDLLGINPNPPPFAKVYVNGFELFKEAIKKYVSEVRQNVFPEEKHYYRMPKEEYNKFNALLKEKLKRFKHS
ncbi:MAG: 3-methyl-2-oxobutanoate hydroxymethyltransferase [Desulfurococcales archaeon ex4484_42]|nr:MAG: 3-methyl-2-oxobutanoate hydroxymethyltransferase [Desulfurococcales archaeon ex4484_42]